MQKDFAVFTAQGNAAVAAVVKDAAAQFDNFKDAWERCCTELEQLQCVKVFAEADDTAVREEVYVALRAAFPEPVFKTVRA